MGNYQSRLDRLEELIAPKDAIHLVIVKDGETQQEAFEVYAALRGLAITEIRPCVIFLTETEARL